MSEHGKFNSHRNLTKALQTLLGLCSGLVADNHLNDDEIRFLSAWLSDNQDATEAWPGCVIRDRVAHVLEDGEITEEERQQLLDVLKELTGNDFMETGSAEPAPVTFPTDNAPIEFTDAVFCLTGKFLYGPRSSIERVIEAHGGIMGGTVNKKTSYLVVGALSSPDWLHSNQGLKIQKAMELKQEGHDIRIVTERAWLDAVGH